MTERRNRRARWALGLLAAGAVVAATASASASDTMDYENYIPNGWVHSCLTCHPTTDGLDQNVFGLDLQNTKGGDGVPPNWAAVCNLDSDGDGQTNGQELGDPCCEWTTGATPGRTADISMPGDATSMAADPASGCSEDDEGCSVTAVRPDVPAGLAGVAVAALLLVGVRRRRR